MTRKDYELIAKTIVAARNRIADDRTLTLLEINNQSRGVRRVAAHLADALETDNPSCDPIRFLKACGYGA